MNLQIDRKGLQRQPNFYAAGITYCQDAAVLFLLRTGWLLLQSRQRKTTKRGGFDLLNSFKQQPSMTAIEIETLAFKRLEAPRIVTV